MKPIDAVPPAAEVATLRYRLVEQGVPPGQAAQIAAASRTRGEITDALKAYVRTLPRREG